MMRKTNIMKTVAAFICLTATAVSCTINDGLTIIDDQSVHQRTVTVNLIQSAQTRTYIHDIDYTLDWLPGDKVMYWTCATESSSVSAWGESKEATIENGSFTALVDEGHKYIRVVYPSEGEGKEYATPKIKQYQNYDAQTHEDVRKTGVFALEIACKYLPMATGIVEIPENNVVNTEYSVLGSVIMFNITAPSNYSLKAIKAGDYQTDFDFRGFGFSSHPDDYTLAWPACVVVPLGANIEYTPTIYLKEWNSEGTEYTCQTFTRNSEKRANFTKPQVQRLNVNLTANADQYTKTEGWKKATDLGLSVAWADMNVNTTSPSGYNTDLTYPGTSDTNNRMCDPNWAVQQWGEGWRLPTYAEWKELAALENKTSNATNNVMTITNNGAMIELASQGGYYYCMSFNDNLHDIKSSSTAYYWMAENTGYVNGGSNYLDRFSGRAATVSGTTIGTESTVAGCNYACIRLVRGINNVESMPSGNLIANNEIIYITSDGQPINLNYSSNATNNANYYGAKLVSNTYENGHGKITFDGDVTKISYNAFKDNTNLTSITLPKSVKEIGSQAFRGCTGLKSFEIPKSVTKIEDGTFQGCTSLTDVVIPDTVTEIGQHAFHDCKSLKNVNLPSSITEIPYYSFQNCSSLTSIVIPEGVTSIGYFAFGYCTNLTSVTMPSTLTEIVSYAFVECKSLTTADIPTSVTLIGEGAFSGCRNLTSAVVIPEGITTIYKQTFLNCSGLTSVVIPSTVTEIRESAFSYCSGLTSVAIPSATTSIGEYAFYGCTGLTSLDLPNTVSEIGKSAFYCCSGLTSFDIPDALTSISQSMLCGCTGLTSIEIPSTVTSIGANAFSGTSISSIVVPETVAEIGAGAFNECNSLTSAMLPSGLTTIADNLFSLCKNLASITIPSGVTSIGSFAFSNCSSLTSIAIPVNVTSIGNSAFLRCTGFKSVTIPEGVTSIGEKAFSNCTGLTSITLHDNVTTIGKYAFSDCTGLTSVTIPDGVSIIDEYTFYQCSGLTSVKMNNVTKIQQHAFYKCTSLTSLQLSNTLTEIGNYAFNTCSSLTSLILPSSLTKLGSSAFGNISTLTEIISLNTTAPSAAGDSFSYNAIKNTCTVKVPAGSVSTYKGKFGWSYIKNNIVALTDEEIAALGQ